MRQFILVLVLVSFFSSAVYAGPLTLMDVTPSAQERIYVYQQGIQMQEKMQQQQQQQQSQLELEQNQRTLKNTFDQLGKERKDICNREEYKIIFNKSPCTINEITFEKLVDTSKMSEIDKPIFSRLYSEIQSLRKRRSEAINAYGGQKDLEMGLVLERTDAQTDTNALKLFEGKITWGEFNKLRKDIDHAINEEKYRIFSAK